MRARGPSRSRLPKSHGKGKPVGPLGRPLPVAPRGAPGRRGRRPALASEQPRMVVIPCDGRSPSGGPGPTDVHLPRRGGRPGGKRRFPVGRPGPGDGRRRGVRLRQERPGPVHHADPPEPSPHRGGPGPLLRGWGRAGRPGRPGPRRPADAGDPRGGDRHDLPGANDGVLTGAHDRRPDRGGGAAAPRHEPGARPGRDHRGPGRGRVPRPAAEGGRLPVRALGRAPPAGDDRDGARVPAGPGHRGRADLGARRDRPGADPRPAGASPTRDGMGLSSSRTTPASWPTWPTSSL